MHFRREERIKGKTLKIFWFAWSPPRCQVLNIKMQGKWRARVKNDWGQWNDKPIMPWLFACVTLEWECRRMMEIMENTIFISKVFFDLREWYLTESGGSCHWKISQSFVAYWSLSSHFFSSPSSKMSEIRTLNMVIECWLVVLNRRGPFSSCTPYHPWCSWKSQDVTWNLYEKLHTYHQRVILSCISLELEWFLEFFAFFLDS